MNNLLIMGLLIYLLGKVVETGVLYLILNLEKEKVSIKGMIKGQIQITVISAIIIAIILKLAVL